jgi:hypothetical protein
MDLHKMLDQVIVDLETSPWKYNLLEPEIDEQHEEQGYLSELGDVWYSPHF